MERIPSNPAAETSEPRLCLARVAGVQARWITLRRTLAAGMAAAGLMLIVLVAVGVDAWLRGGPAVRFALLILSVAALVGVVVRYVRPLCDRISRDKATLLLEGAHPDLSGRLVTAVQLAPSTGRTVPGLSPDLYEQVRRDAESRASALDPAAAVPAADYVRSAAVAWLFAAVLVFAFVMSVPYSTIGLYRLLLPWSAVHYPQWTRLSMEDADRTAPILVKRGGTLVLAGSVAGYLPSTGTLHVRSRTGASDRARFEIDYDGTFTVRYRPVNQDLSVFVEAGDARSEPLEVVMVPPPEIEQIQTERVSPAYTRLAPERIPDGNVQAVFGSDVRVSIVAGKPIAGATLEWDDRSLAPLRRLSPTEAELRFRVTAGRSYRIFLRDELGFHNEDPVVYRVEMIENQYPRFEQVTPAADKRAGAKAVVPLAARVVDDFGVAAVDLCYRREAEEEPQRIPVPLERVTRQADVRYEWPLESAGAAAGETILYWLEARDEGEHAEKQDWPTSRPRRLHILDEPELARLLNEELEQILDRLADLEALQGEATDAVSRMEQQAAEPPDDAAEVDRVSQRARAEKWRQERLARTAGQLAERLVSVAEDYAISRVGRPERVERLQRTAADLARIASATMPAAVLSLDDALSAVSGLDLSDLGEAP